MFISKILTINWGNIPNKAIKFEPSTLIYGTNGAGKSTILDAIQLIMTAGLKELCYFNRAGSENATTRSKKETHRDWLGYARGCDQGLVSRPEGGLSYVALSFEPDAHEDVEGFTAVMGCEFSGGENPDILAKSYFLIESNLVAFEDFIKDNRTKLLKQFKADCQDKFSGGQLHTYDTPTGFLTALWSAIEGRALEGPGAVSKEEAKRKTKNWTKLIGFQGDQDVATLVREEILEAPSEKMKESVIGLKDTMAQLKGLEDEADRMRQCIESLSEIDLLGKRARDHVLKTAAAKSTLLQSNAEESQSRLDRAHRQQEEFEQALATVKANSAVLDDTIKSLSDQIKSKQGLLKFDGSDARAEVLGKDLAIAAQKAQQTAKALQDTLNVIQFSVNILGSLDLPSVSEDLVDNLKETVDACKLEINKSNPSAMTFAELESHAEQLRKLLGEQGDIWKDIKSAEDAINEELGPVKASLKTMAAQEAGAKSGQRFAPPFHYTQALDALQGAFPQAKPRLLCDVAYIDDKKWQKAIEAYLGVNRFLILVEQGFEAKAIDYLRKQGHSKARVFQTQKAMKDYNPSRIRAGGVSEKVNTDDAIARLCIDIKFGATACVDTTEQAKDERLAITADGVVSSGYTLATNEFDRLDLFMVDVMDPAAIESLRARIAEYEAVKRSLETKLTDLRRMDLLKGKAIESPFQLASAWLSANAEAEDLKSDLNDIEGLEDNSLIEKEIELLEKQKDAAYNQKLSFNSEMTLLAGKIQSAKSEGSAAAYELSIRQDELKALTGQLELAYFNGSKLVDLVKDMDASDAMPEKAAQYEDIFNQAIADASTAIAVYLAKPAFSELERLDRGLLESRPSKDRGLVEKCIWIDQLLAEAGTRLKRQRDTGLANNTEKITRLRQTMDATLSGTLAAQVVEQVNSIDRTLAKVNADLVSIKVGDNTYRFGSEFIAEYKDYYDFFKLISESGDQEGSDQFQLFTGSVQGIPENLMAVKDRLLEILSSPDEAVAEKALLQITDYRLYKDYQLLRRADHGGEVNMAKENTGSGGQSQPAYYLVRCAILQKELGFRNTRQKACLRTVMMDEAFSRMDEHRIYDAMQLIEQVMGFKPIMVAPQGRQDKMILSSTVDKALGFEKFYVEKDKAPLVQIQEISGLRAPKFKKAVAEFRSEVKTQAMLELGLLESDLAEVPNAKAA